MSRAWMPLYVADYLADTGELSTLEHGAYMLLIMHYWSKGGLPNDDQKLARITRLSPKEWQAVRDTLASLFGPEWSHKRIDAELAKAEEKHERRAEAGRKGGMAKAAGHQNPSNATAMPEPRQSNAVAGLCQSQSQSEPEEILNKNRLQEFPRDGSIAFSDWAASARSAGRNIDVDVLAQAFRGWCRSKDIQFNNPHIAKQFETFCKGHKVGGTA
jgi:uncharacterized protein YdaU (DUF1376 family)